MVSKKLFFADFFLGLVIVHVVSGSNTGLDAVIDFSEIKSAIVLWIDSKRAHRRA
jgi:hypothetical protein